MRLEVDRLPGLDYPGLGRAAARAQNHQDRRGNRAAGGAARDRRHRMTGRSHAAIIRAAQPNATSALRPRISRMEIEIPRSAFNERQAIADTGGKDYT